MENIKEKFEFEVSSEYEGMRLDKYLSEQIEEATRSYLEKLIDNNFVKVNSKVINKNGRKLKLGEKIEVLIPEEENIDIEAENIPLDVVYENDDFIVIIKIMVWLFTQLMAIIQVLWSMLFYIIQKIYLL